MQTFYKISFLFFLSLFYFNSLKATHIVGGALTYVHNGGNNYTITCKLYRDCRPGTFPMPNNLNVIVRGLNGATFSPSRDISLARIQITPLPPSLDSCAIRPNPEPCVEEGLFRATLDLPPSPGGYHMYISMLARNLTLTNINSAGNNIGETFYCFIPPPTLLWQETYTLANGTTVDNGATAWSINNGSTPPFSAAVNGNQFQVAGANNGNVWFQTQSINIAASNATGGADLSVNLNENGTLEPNDSIKVFYRVDAGPLIPFSRNGALADDFTSAVAFTSGVVGNNVVIYVKVVFDPNSPNTEIYGIDDVSVYFKRYPNSDPVFKLFPPLYLCVGQRFEFDHSATDLDGDSLVYSFYRPYDGFNGAGTAVAPAYVNNYPTFTQINYLPGYSLSDPLGASGISINTQTGFLTGLPTQIGQYVVGIKVTEYRNGVFLSETIRDFQFNVIRCPPPNQAILTQFTTCVGTTVKFSTASDTLQTTTWWDFGDPATLADTSIKHAPSYTYPAIGTYYVTLITNKGTVCEDSARAPVYVGWARAAFSKSTQNCVGYPVSFIDSSVVSFNTSIAAYTWNFGDGSSSNSPNPNHIYASPGTYTVILTVRSNVGCIDTAMTTVTIASAPNVNAGPDQTVCSSSPLILLNGSVTNATGGIWSSTGSGVFSSTTNLTGVTYYPSSADISAGVFNIILTSVSTSVCVIKDTVKVRVVSSPTISNAGNDQIICGVNSTILTANVPGVGSGLWTTTATGVTILNPSSPTTQVAGLAAGANYNFTWTITNGASCSSTDVVTVLVDNNPTTSNAGSDQVLCNLSSTALAANTPSVGTGSWSVVSGNVTLSSASSATSNLSNLTAGDTVIVRWTISQGICSNFDDVKIIVNRIPEVNAGTDQDLCNQNPVVQLNGAINNASGGVWSGGSGTYNPGNLTLNGNYIPTASEISFGSVTLTLTSTGNGACSAVSDQVKINFLPFNGTIAVNSSPTACIGEINGLLVASVNGTSNYNYTWSSVPIQYNDSAYNLAAGTYGVTVTDALGCKATSSGEVTSPALLTATISTTNVLCNGNANGLATVVPSGGNGSYSYSWVPNVGNTSTVNNLTAGNYVVYITDSKNCQINKSISITQPPVLQVSSNQQNVLCNGGNNGSINVNPTGGTTPFSYSWSSPLGNGPSASGLSQGVYSVTVTDANGCSFSISDTIIQPSVLTVSTAVTNVDCKGNTTGSAIANASGGTLPYTYSWGPNISATLNQVSGLGAGNYFVKVIDANACQVQTTFAVSEPSLFAADIASLKNVSCANGSDASILVSANGGIGPYTFNWSPNVSSTNAANNLPAGLYTIQVRDQNNCQVQLSQSVTQPSALSVSETHTNPTCFGYNNGSINVSASGGTSPYNYFWSVSGIGSVSSFNSLPFGAYTINVSDSNGCSAQLAVALSQPSDIVLSTSSISSTCGNSNGSGTVISTGGVAPFTYSWVSQSETTNTLSNVLAGNYLVYVIDATLCFDSAFVLINDIAGPTISIVSINNVSCFGGSDGSATIAVNAGTPPFTYSWSTNPSQNTPTAIGLSAGEYAVVVTDGNGCKTSALTTPPISQPDSLTYDFKVIDALCFNSPTGSAYINPNGGTTPYSVNWINPVLTSDSIVNVLSGTYQFIIEDNNGCQKNGEVNISQPSLLQSSLISYTDITCLGADDGTAQVNVTGGVTPYNFSWSNSSSTSSFSGSLPAGQQQVIVTDANLCMDTVSFSLNEPADSVSAAITTNAVTCFNGSNGSAEIIASGGNGTYTYTWLPIGSNGSILSSLSAGDYSVIVNDVKGCSDIFSFQILQPNRLTSNTNVNNSTCSLSNGSISSSASGGNGGYNYIWNPGNLSGPFINNLLAGTYYLTVLDSLGCEFKDTILITNASGPQITNSVIVNVSCFGLSDGEIALSVGGGTNPLTFSWNPSFGNDSVLTNLAQGNYVGYVKDVNGCIDSVTLNVTQPLPLIIDSVIVEDISCFGLTNGEAQVIVSGGTPSYNYSWCLGNNTNQNITGLPKGSCFVFVTDANNCKSNISFTINEPDSLNVTPSAVINATCKESADGSLSVLVSGGTIPYSYSWSHNPSLNDGLAQNLNAGTYSVIVTDANGCMDSISVDVAEPSDVLVVVANDPVICLGQSATLLAIASGGNGSPYQYEWQPVPGNGNTLTVNPQQNQTYYVIAYDNKGCVSALDQAEVTVYSLFAGDIDLFVKTPICQGTSTTLQAISNGTNTGPLTYTWNQGLGNNPGPITVVPNAPTVYSVTVSTSCGTSVVVRDTVNFIDPPVVNFTGDTAQGCYPLLVVFADSSLQNPSDSIVSWIWNFGDGSTSTQQNPTYVYQDVGSYNVTLNVITKEGCNIITASGSYQVNVFDRPTSAFNASPQPVYIPLGEVSFENTSINANTYTWNFGDGIISTDKNPKYEYGNVGNYEAMLIAIDSKGCRDTAIKTILVSGDFIMPNAFTPNPAGPSGGLFNPASLDNDIFAAYVKGAKEYKMHIFNRWGELIFESTDPTIGWDGYYREQICQAGVYIWQVYILFNDGRELKRVGDLNLIR